MLLATLDVLGRRTGYVVILLGGFLAIAMAAVHGIGPGDDEMGFRLRQDARRARRYGAGCPHTPSGVSTAAEPDQAFARVIRIGFATRAAEDYADA